MAKLFKNDLDEGTAYMIMKVGIVIAEHRKDADYEKIFDEAKQIYNDWNNNVDVQSIEEAGYIQAYAYRKVRESNKKEKVIPKRYLTNLLGEVLFKKGKKYDAVVANGYYYITNETDGISSVRERDIHEDFEIYHE